MDKMLIYRLKVVWIAFSIGVMSSMGFGGTDSPVSPPQIVSTFTAAGGTVYPFRENMYEPVLLPDGRILALSVGRRDGEQVMQGRYSSDNGRTWSAASDLFRFGRSEGGFALFERLLDRDGEIHIFILGDANSGTLFPSSQEAAPVRTGEVLEIWHVKSLDHLKRWTAPRRISEQGDDMLSVIQLANGRIVLPVSFRRLEDYNSPRKGFEGYTYDGSYGASSLYSDDEGETWQRSPDVLIEQTPDLGTYGLNEPVVIQLKDGRVWMLVRSQRGRFYQSFSPDGAHWSAVEPTDLISSDSPAGLLRLRDGGILLFSNACQRYPYAYGGRDVLHGAISYDEGKSWRGFRELFRDPLSNQPVDFHGDYGYSYTFPCLTADGKVLFTNWVEPDCGKTRTFKLFDPRWLLQTKQETDFSSGIEDWSFFGSRGVELKTDGENGSSKALEIRKAEATWPAAAEWNFPLGARGTLDLRMKLQAGFNGARLGLTDHFSVPWDDEDRFFNAFNLSIEPDGTLSSGQKMSVDRWHDLHFEWDSDALRCRLSVDGQKSKTMLANRHTAGVNYLRLCSTSGQPDGGLVISAVKADVSKSW
jgi:hypothetical protein